MIVLVMENCVCVCVYVCMCVCEVAGEVDIIACYMCNIAS